MEEEYEKLAVELSAKGITVAKYRGDVDREFVKAEFNVKAFPTINVVTKDGLVKYFSEDRQMEQMLAFFDEQTGAAV